MNAAYTCPQKVRSSEYLEIIKKRVQAAESSVHLQYFRAELFDSMELKAHLLPLSSAELSEIDLQAYLKAAVLHTLTLQ